MEGKKFKLIVELAYGTGETFMPGAEGTIVGLMAKGVADDVYMVNFDGQSYTGHYIIMNILKNAEIIKDIDLLADEDLLI